MRRSRGPTRRILPRALFLAFVALLFISILITWIGGGGKEKILSFDMPASNLETLKASASHEGGIREPEITARSAVLLDTSTGEVLFEKNPDLELPMASTTKIMTAIITLENASLEEKAVISERASSTGESSAWLEKGEILTVDQLLHALMVQSANDSAVALAEHVAGSVEAFVDMMNRKAASLGANHTHFANPHGLDEEDHYTTARDLAVIAAYAMRNPVFREIVVSDRYEIPWPGHPYPRVMVNHNKFLKLYPYATGIKTGYTERAGKCLVASASKDGRELISVILNGGESYWDQTIRLMNYGFEDFVRVEYAYTGQRLVTVDVGKFPRKKVSVVPRYDIAFIVRKDRLPEFYIARVSYPQWIAYPVEKGRELGRLTVGEGNLDERSAVLVSAEDCRPPNPVCRFFAFLGSVLGLWWKWIRFLIPGL